MADRKVSIAQLHMEHYRVWLVPRRLGRVLRRLVPVPLRSDRRRRIASTRGGVIVFAGMFQTARSILRFWRMTANLDGAHAELERNLMQDKWGPPANGEGWPTFDERGKRILDDHLGPEEKSQIDKGVAEIKRLLGPEIEMLPEIDGAA